MDTPILILNLKNYEQGVLGDSQRLLDACEEVASKPNCNIAVAPSLIDLINVNHDKEDSYVLSQHVDPVAYGSHTGGVVPRMLSKMGVDGTLLNHSERRLDFFTLQETVKTCQEEGLETIVCVQNKDEATLVDQMDPTYIAIEPPELIGGDVSISSARPELITDTVESVNTPILCGAGVHERRDVEKGLELGAKGVLLAHAVVQAEDPVAVLEDMMAGF